MKTLRQYRLKTDRPREIRVFLSSTFSDMNSERDRLVKLFVRLRPLALSRGVNISLVDLRWGVTREEALSGKVLEICLREIDRCRPFFVGIVGHRYGWCPGRDEISGIDSDGKYAPVMDYLDRGMSITEIEMQYGVLNNDRPIEAAFFIKSGGDAEESGDDSGKLRRLREAITSQNRYPSYSYDDAGDLVDKVEREFTGMLDRLYPETVGQEDREEIREQSQRFALLDNYQPRSGADRAISGFLKSRADKPLLITGQPGSGKCALLAYWSGILDRDDSGVTLVYHSLDSSAPTVTPAILAGALARKSEESFASRGLGEASASMRSSSSPSASAANILGSDAALMAMLGWQGDSLADNISQMYEDSASVKSLAELSRLLGLTGEPVALLIDNIDLLEDAEGEFPAFVRTLPAGVKLIATSSSVPEKLKDSVTVYELPALDNAEISEFIRCYLGRFSKALSPEQEEIIARWPLAGNPQMLMSLLSELVRFGSFEKLTDYIRSFTSRDTVEGFCNRLLDRLTADYGRDKISSPLLFLASTGMGFTEDELKLLSETDGPTWIQLREELASMLTETLGAYRFRNPQISKTVLDYFAPSEDEELMLRYGNIILALSDKGDINPELSFADYNWRHDRFLYRDEYRHVAEVIHQQLNVCDLDSLERNLLKPAVFEILYRNNRQLLKEAWFNLIIMEDDYNPIKYLKSEFYGISMQLKTVVMNDIATFLGRMGFDKAATLLRDAVAQMSGIPPIARTVMRMNQGNSYARQENYEEAIRIYREVLADQELLTPTPHLEIANTKRCLAFALYYTKKYGEAAGYALEAFATYRELADNSYGAKAADTGVLMAEAMTYNREYQAAAEVFPEVIGLAEAYSGRLDHDTLKCRRMYGECLFNLRRYDQAYGIFETSLRLAIEADDSQEIRFGHSNMQHICEQLAREAKARGDQPGEV